MAKSSRRRRQNPYVPDVVGVPFTQGDEPLESSSGAPQFFGANTAVLPRAASSLQGTPLVGVWGRPAPMQATVQSYRGRVAVPLLKRTHGPIAPLQSRLSFPLWVRLQNRSLRAVTPSVGFCFKRSRRREVLFARNIAGHRKSPGKGGSYHRTEYSHWRC